MKHLRKTHLAIALAMTAGIISGCQNNSTRASADGRDDAQVVSMKKDADVENRSADKASVLPRGQADQRDNEYSMQEDYPGLNDQEGARNQNAARNQNLEQNNQERNQYSDNRQPAGNPASLGDNEIVLFGFDSADLTDDAKESLDALAESLRGQDAGVEAVTIRGYADATGPQEYNEHLSQRRAESVRDYLRDRGIEANTWNVEGRGEQDPVASNDDERGRSENRRVVVEMSSDNRGLTSSYEND